MNFSRLRNSDHFPHVFQDGHNFQLNDFRHHHVCCLLKFDKCRIWKYTEKEYIRKNVSFKCYVVNEKFLYVEVRCVEIQFDV